MKPEGKVQAGCVYVKKELHFTVPSLNNMHARKNPFSRAVKAETLQERKEELSEPETRKIYAHTLRPPKVYASPRPDFEKIQQPTQRLTDICDTITESCCSWITESEQELDQREFTEEEAKGTASPKLTVLNPQLVNKTTSYCIQMTREVEFNLRQIQRAELATAEEVALRQVSLPTASGPKKILILDMDDTLIHTINPLFNYAALNVVHSDVRNVFYQTPSAEVFSVNFVIRPYASQLLKELSELYRIVIFTAAQKSYANAILNILDPDKKYISHRVYRENCVYKNGNYLKDLRIFKNCDLKEMVIVDNSMVAFAKHLPNGIHVPTYFGQSDDTALLLLIPFLVSLNEADDIPKELEKRLGLTLLYDWYIKNNSSKPVV